MVNRDRASLIEALVPLARRAAQLIMEVYATSFEVIDKGEGDPVTVADRRANALICEGLASLFPGVPVVAEESDEATYTAYHEAPEAFYVDPLDGTREFVARNGEFVVMIGFAEQGRPTAGVLLAPASGLLWTGAVGHGAHEHPASGSPTPLRVAPVSSPSDARFVVSRSRRAPSLQALLDRTRPRSVTPLGSAGLKCAAIARNHADAYVQLEGAGCLWDTCAPEAIVLAAGGLFSRPTGALIDYRGGIEIEDGIVVASPPLHAALLRELRAPS